MKLSLGMVTAGKYSSYPNPGRLGSSRNVTRQRFEGDLRDKLTTGRLGFGGPFLWTIFGAETSLVSLETSNNTFGDVAMITSSQKTVYRLVFSRNGSNISKQLAGFLFEGYGYSTSKNLRAWNVNAESRHAICQRESTISLRKSTPFPHSANALCVKKGRLLVRPLNPGSQMQKVWSLR